jgi:hypothetical protein
MWLLRPQVPASEGGCVPAGAPTLKLVWEWSKSFQREWDCTWHLEMMSVYIVPQHWAKVTDNKCSSSDCRKTIGKPWWAVNAHHSGVGRYDMWGYLDRWRSEDDDVGRSLLGLARGPEEEFPQLFGLLSPVQNRSPPSYYARMWAWWLDARDVLIRATLWTLSLLTRFCLNVAPLFYASNLIRGSLRLLRAILKWLLWGSHALRLLRAMRDFHMLCLSSRISKIRWLMRVFGSVDDYEHLLQIFWVECEDRN